MLPAKKNQIDVLEQRLGGKKWVINQTFGVCILPPPANLEAKKLVQL